MSDYVVNEVGGVFVLPIDGFISAEVRGGELILRSPGSKPGLERTWSGSLSDAGRASRERR